MALALSLSFFLSPILQSTSLAVDKIDLNGGAPIDPNRAGESPDASPSLPNAADPKSCDQALRDKAALELAALKSDESVGAACAQAGVCEVGESKITRRFQLFKFLRSMVVQSGVEIWESVKAVRGRELRKNPNAMLDFVKNMAIIWPGQIFGWMREQAKTGAVSNIFNAPYTIFFHTFFMVWTQSDRGAGNTPDVDSAESKAPKKLWNWVDRALTKTPRPVGDWSRNLLESTLPALSMIQEAYRGKNGFWKENGQRFVGFLSIIPLEVLSLTLMESLKATPGLIQSGHLPEGFGGILANRALFAVMFGVYLSLKWALFSKVFDLRVLPAFRGWLSSGWQPQWQSLKEKYGMRFREGEVFDELKLGRLLTVDLYKALRGQRYASQVEGCRLVAQKSMGEDGDGKGWREYCQRWSAYSSFAKSGEFWTLLREKPGTWLKHIAGFPIEMTYRYGNSFLDGALVFWLINSAVPAMLN